MSEAKKYLTKRQLADRWQCCTKTIERLEQAGKLVPIYISERLKRYPEDMIEQAERTGTAS